MIRLLFAIGSLFELMSPVLTNMFLALLCYLEMERHAYSMVASVALFLILNEFERLKRCSVLWR